MVRTHQLFRAVKSVKGGPCREKVNTLGRVSAMPGSRDLSKSLHFPEPSIPQSSVDGLQIAQRNP